MPVSVTAFGRDLGLSYGRAQGWEKGQLPNADDLELLSRRLHISPDWLLLGIGEPFEDRAESESIPPVVPALPVPPEAMQVTGLAQCGVEGWECTRRMAVTTERLPGLGPDAVAVLPVGDSMLPEGIREGFVCYCDPSREPEAGDAVYVEQADGSATIKLWHGSAERKGFVRLQGWLPRRNGGIQQPFDLEIAQEHIKRVAPVVYVKRRM
ncbi:MAG: S24 family peptidase [Halodesulfovibrio sp.]